MEAWRQIPSLPEYEASSLGRVKRIPYQSAMPNGGLRTYGGEPRFGCWSRAEQRFILVFRGKTYKVARLVCEAFHGHAPEGENVCLHLDEDPSNNRPENLRWGTQTENLNMPKVKAYHSDVCRDKMSGSTVTDHERSYSKRAA